MNESIARASCELRWLMKKGLADSARIGAFIMSVHGFPVYWHEDCDRSKNLLFIPTGDKELLVAADLEDVTWIKSTVKSGINV